MAGELNVDPGGDPFGFDDLDPAWLAGKPGAKWQRHPGHLAAWVADMDFPPAPTILDALRALVDGGDLGYPNWLPFGVTPLRALFAERMRDRHGWAPEVDHTRDLVDVIQGVRLVLHLMTRPGDGVVLHTPSYPPFQDSLRTMHRSLVEVRAHPAADGWVFDYDDLERRLRAEPGSAKAWILCHPHNPTGHVFDEAELTRIADIALRHDLLVISDEIHADLVYAPSRHVPLAKLSDDVEAITVTLTSVSKAFNLAGLRWAVAHVGAPGVRAAIDELPTHLLGAPNVMAVAAAQAAWTRGGQWLEACVTHLDRQRHRLAGLLAEHVPGVVYRLPQATYLAWLDCTGLDLDEEPVEVFRRGGVALSPGPDFGPAGHGFVRLNFATSGPLLERIVTRMGAALPSR